LWDQSLATSSSKELVGIEQAFLSILAEVVVLVAWAVSGQSVLEAHVHVGESRQLDVGNFDQEGITRGHVSLSITVHVVNVALLVGLILVRDTILQLHWGAQTSKEGVGNWNTIELRLDTVNREIDGGASDELASWDLKVASLVLTTSRGLVGSADPVVILATNIVGVGDWRTGISGGVHQVVLGQHGFIFGGIHVQLNVEGLVDDDGWE